MTFAPVNRILDRIQSQEKWARERLWRKIFHHWPGAVGELVAPHTMPTGLHRQVLQVAVSSGVWAQSLTFERRSILTKLHHLIEDKTIVDIHFSTARWEKHTATPSTNKAKNQKTKDLPQSPQEAIDRCVSVLQQQKTLKHRCPQCGAPASLKEIDRWQMCHHCACRLFFCRP